MSNENALTPVDQRIVSFYSDEITAVLVVADESEQVYVPVRPICDFLGLDWPGQYQRLKRDAVLSQEIVSVGVIPTETGQGRGTREMVCLPLDMLNGWVRLFTRTLIAA